MFVNMIDVIGEKEMVRYSGIACADPSLCEPVMMVSCQIHRGYSGTAVRRAGRGGWAMVQENHSEVGGRWCENTTAGRADSGAEKTLLGRWVMR